MREVFNMYDEEDYLGNEYHQWVNKQQAEQPNMNSQQGANRQQAEQPKMKNQQDANKEHHKQANKRPRPSTGDGKSGVWEHYTKIYTGDPNVVYAACKGCDIMINAPSKNGTTHLWRHIQKHCPCLQQPAQ
jgi:hypothetical protein